MKRALVLAAVLMVFVSLLTPQATATTSTKGYIVVLKDSVTDPAAVASQHGHAYGFVAKFVYGHALKGYAASLSSKAAQAIAGDPRVAFLQTDITFSTPEGAATALTGASNGGGGQSSTCPVNTTSGFPTQCIPPGVDRVDADLSTTRAGDGRGSVSVNVAVVDSGIDATHPDLNVVGGVNCSNGKSYADAFYHGTFVAGVIGARDNGSGIVGVAPGANLWSVRVLNNKGTGSASSVLCGVDWVTATRTDADTTNDIAVANMSIGGNTRKIADDGNCGYTNNDALHQAICASTAAGVTYVVGAGNASDDLRFYEPAGYREVVTATAMADYDGQPGGLSALTCSGIADDTVAFFSNFATLPADDAHTIAGPGACVVSTIRVGYFLPDFSTNYAIASGTSFATPHVAGTVALCIFSGPCAGLTPAQIVQKMVSDATAYNTANPGYGFTGDPLHTPDPNKYYGYLVRAALY